MELLFVFFLAFVVSFAGTIPPASVNLTAIRISMEQGRSEALSFSLGAISIEAVLCFVSLEFASFIASHQEIDFWLKWIAVVVFLVMGVAALWPSSSPVADEIKVSEIKKNHWWKTNFTYGMFICVINPMQIPFWLAWGTYFYTNGWLATDLLSTLVFVIGSIAGTYMLLYLFVKYAATVLSRILKGNFSAKRVIGYVFIVLGLVQLAQNLWAWVSPV